MCCPSVNTVIIIQFNINLYSSLQAVLIPRKRGPGGGPETDVKRLRDHRRPDEDLAVTQQGRDRGRETRNVRLRAGNAKIRVYFGRECGLMSAPSADFQLVPEIRLFL